MTVYFHMDATLRSKGFNTTFESGKEHIFGKFSLLFVKISQQQQQMSLRAVSLFIRPCVVYHFSSYKQLTVLKVKT